MTKLMKAYQRFTSVTEVPLLLVTFGGPIAVYILWIIDDGDMELVHMIMAYPAGGWLLFGFWIVAAIRKQIEERFGKESSDE